MIRGLTISTPYHDKPLSFSNLEKFSQNGPVLAGVVCVFQSGLCNAFSYDRKNQKIKLDVDPFRA